jgi:transcriptional regulator with XRE-family HTH domain
MSINTSDKKMLAVRIKELRIMNGLTQEPFGELFGLTKATISNLETGYRDLLTTISKLVEIADHFDVSTDWLLGRTDNPQSHHAPVAPNAPADPIAPVELVDNASNI